MSNPANEVEAAEVEATADEPVTAEAAELADAAEVQAETKPDAELTFQELREKYSFAQELSVPVEEFDRERESLARALTDAIDKEKSALYAKKRAALAAVMIRYHIIRDGHPDWNAGSDAYRYAVDSVFRSVYADQSYEVKTRTDAAVKALVNRTFREVVMAWHVLRNADASLLPDEYEVPDEPCKDPRKVIKVEDVDTVKIVRASEALSRAMRAEYEVSKLTVPDAYLPASQRSSVGTGGTGGDDGGTSAQDNPRAVLAQAFEAVAKMDAREAFHSRAVGLIRYASDLSDDLLATLPNGSVGEREKVIEALQRVSAITFETAALLDGEAKNPDASRKTIEANRYTESDEQ